MDWRRATVAPDRTHHLIDGAPAYAARYVDVLKFHPPGLAPARAPDGATHITPRGEPAYTGRFERTFGFYEGLAAVVTPQGWVHVRPDGAPIVDDRFAWCGNYQGGRCAARTFDGWYLHLDVDGRAAYPGRWRYAGDYRDGVAVVQRGDGSHSHVDANGRLLHGRWFVDLDVFHKGFARARDDAGWTHVDETGVPVYEARFAAVEPFYNGQARVERRDGGLEVIDEQGATVITLRPARDSGFHALSRDLVGAWRTDTLAGAVALGVIEALPATQHGLADRLGLHPQRLGALLRALRDLDVASPRGDSWHLTAKGALLRRDHPLTLADAAVEYAGPLRALWGALPDALRGAHPRDVFADVAADPQRIAPHHRMLASYARHDYEGVPGALGLQGHERVLDVGGGVGALASLLLDAHPQLDVVLLDRPEVLDLVEVGLRSRVTRVGADLFGPWGVQADVVLLARVVHDWDDARAVQILRSARDALRPGGRLFVVELVVQGDGAFGGLCDLHLLLATGGRERSEAEYARLFDAAGFDLTGVRSSPSVPSVLVGAPR